MGCKYCVVFRQLAPCHVAQNSCGRKQRPEPGHAKQVRRPTSDTTGCAGTAARLPWVQLAKTRKMLVGQPSAFTVFADCPLARHAAQALEEHPVQTCFLCRSDKLCNQAGQHQDESQALHCPSYGGRPRAPQGMVSSLRSSNTSSHLRCCTLQVVQQSAQVLQTSGDGPPRGERTHTKSGLA